MLEVIIAYVTIAGVVYVVTKNKESSLKWPFTVVRFCIDLVNGLAAKKKEE